MAEIQTWRDQVKKHEEALHLTSSVIMQDMINYLQHLWSQPATTLRKAQIHHLVWVTSSYLIFRAYTYGTLDTLDTLLREKETAGETATSAAKYAWTTFMKLTLPDLHNSLKDMQQELDKSRLEEKVTSRESSPAPSVPDLPQPLSREDATNVRLLEAFWFFWNRRKSVERNLIKDTLCAFRLLYRIKIDVEKEEETCTEVARKKHTDNCYCAVDDFLEQVARVRAACADATAPSTKRKAEFTE